MKAALFGSSAALDAERQQVAPAPPHQARYSRCLKMAAIVSIDARSLLLYRMPPVVVSAHVNVAAVGPPIIHMFQTVIVPGEPGKMTVWKMWAMGGGLLPQAWCFTSDDKSKWGFCDVGTAQRTCDRRPRTTKCADQDGVCRCDGEVRFGSGDTWSSPLHVQGAVGCSGAVVGAP